MSASRYCKAQGLPSLQHVSRETDTTRDTLRRWYRDKPRRFRAIVAGARVLQENPQEVPPLEHE